jgi:hypothetical protein
LFPYKDTNFLRLQILKNDFYFLECSRAISANVLQLKEVCGFYRNVFAENDLPFTTKFS